MRIVILHVSFWDISILQDVPAHLQLTKRAQTLISEFLEDVSMSYVTVRILHGPADGRLWPAGLKHGNVVEIPDHGLKTLLCVGFVHDGRKWPVARHKWRMLRLELVQEEAIWTGPI